MVLRHRRVATSERVRELIDSAFATRYHEVDKMLELSSTAVALAEEKRAELSDDLMAAAWTQYGNALRIAGHNPEAERALDRAATFPTSDLPTKIHLFEVTSSLYRSTGRLDNAISILRSAIEAYRSSGDTAGEARTQNLLGIVYFDKGQPRKALRAYQAALDLLGSDASLESFASASHNLLEGLIADGRLGAAASVMTLLEPFQGRLTSARLSAKAMWMRARLCREQKHFDAARLAYQRAFDLLSTEPRSPELAELAQEMADLLPTADPES